MRPKSLKENTYPIQVSVYGLVCMKIVETFGYIQQLETITLSAKYDCREDSLD